MGGQKGPKWKREAVPDHKFDFIDTRDYHSKALGIRLQYLWVYILVIKSFLVYISDIYTATTMLTSKDWSNKIFTACQDPRGCVAIPFAVAKWLFVGCIIFFLPPAGIRGAQGQEDHRQSRHFLRLH